jgi:hypothetical protein
MIDKAGHIASAAEAVAVFQKHCGTGDEHAIADLICGSGHRAADQPRFRRRNRRRARSRSRGAIGKGSDLWPRMQSRSYLRTAVRRYTFSRAAVLDLKGGEFGSQNLEQPWKPRQPGQQPGGNLEMPCTKSSQATTFGALIALTYTMTVL